MPTLSLSLPAPMLAWVEAQARTGPHATPADYIRALIAQDKDRAEAHDELQRLATAAIASGISKRTMPEIFAEARALAKADREARP